MAGDMRHATEDIPTLMWDQPEGQTIEVMPVAGYADDLAARLRLALARGTSKREPMSIQSVRIDEAEERIYVKTAYVTLGYTYEAAERIAAREPGRLPHA